MERDDTIFKSREARVETYIDRERLELTRIIMTEYFKISYDKPELVDSAMLACCAKKLQFLGQALEIEIEVQKHHKSTNIMDITMCFNQGMGGTGQKMFPLVMDEILSDDYTPPEDITDVVIHILFASMVYDAVVKVQMPVPKEIIYQLDVSTLKMVLFLGQRQTGLDEYFRKWRHKQSVVKGKQRQKDETIDKILKTYKAIGAQWCSDEPKMRPILFKHRRIAISRLASDISAHLKREFTERHINNCIKELRKAGEI